ncbi:DUF2782 domain-containing protein [Endothiovibrio diazotrophicus]
MRYSMLVLLFAAAPLFAAEDPGPMVAPPPPGMAEGAAPADGGSSPASRQEELTVRENADGSTTITLPGGETLEPEVTIREKGEKTITEYRVAGRLYMIKVKPAVGPAYYLSDTDGDGNLETRQSELDPGFMIPKWILFQW